MSIPLIDDIRQQYRLGNRYREVFSKSETVFECKALMPIAVAFKNDFNKLHTKKHGTVINSLSTFLHKAALLFKFAFNSNLKTFVRKSHFSCMLPTKS